MAQIAVDEHPSFVTVLAYRRRYRAAVMRWDAFQERYNPSVIQKAKSKDDAEKKAKALAEFCNLELKDIE